MDDVSLTITLPTVQEQAAISSCNWLSPQAKVSNADAIPSQGYRGFFLSPQVLAVNSPLDGTYKLFGEEGFPGFVSASLSSGNGTFTNPIQVQLNIQGTSQDSLGYITFDPSTGEHASEISISITSFVDGVEKTESGIRYANNSVNFTFIIPKNAVTMTISLVRWSHPYKNAKVVGFGTAGVTSIDIASQLLDLSYSQNTVASTDTVRPGIVEQYLEASFYDKGHLFENLYQLMRLTEGLSVKVREWQTNPDMWVDIGTYRSEQWDFDATTGIVKLVCADPTKTITTQEGSAWPLMDRPFSSVQSTDTISVRYMLQQEIRKMSGMSRTDLRAYGGLNSAIKFKGLYKPEESLSTTIQNICTVTASSFYWDGSGFTFRGLYDGY